MFTTLGNISTNTSTPKSAARFAATFAHNGLEAIVWLRKEHPMSLKEAGDLIKFAWENDRNFGNNYTPFHGWGNHQFSPRLGKCACAGWSRERRQRERAIG